MSILGVFIGATESCGFSKEFWKTLQIVCDLFSQITDWLDGCVTTQLRSGVVRSFFYKLVCRFCGCVVATEKLNKSLRFELEVPRILTQITVELCEASFKIFNLKPWYNTLNKLLTWAPGQTDTRDRRHRLKPALVQNTDYMVEKTFHLALYLGAFGAHLIPQWPI